MSPYRERHRAAGLCVQCRNPRVEGRTRCLTCLIKNRMYMDAYRKKKKTQV